MHYELYLVVVVVSSESIFLIPPLPICIESVRLNDAKIIAGDQLLLRSTG